MHEETNINTPKKSYMPLIVLFVVSILMALALSRWSDLFFFMQFFMGSLLTLLSLVKLFNIQGFAKIFHLYDLLAQRVKFYGFVYPFLELFLGLGFLSGMYFPWFAAATFILMCFGSLGVLQAIRKKMDLQCACMGSILQVPLSYVSLGEDILMGVLSCVMFIMYFV